MNSRFPHRQNRQWLNAFILLLLSLGILIGTIHPQSAAAQNELPTDTLTPTETWTPTPTLPPTATPTPPFSRPLVVVSGYGTSSDAIYPGDQFDLRLQLINSGKSSASNIVISFKAGDFVTRSTGGVIAVKEIRPDSQENITQPLTAGQGLWGITVGSIEINISYTDQNGTAYQENFTLSIPITQPRIKSNTATPTPTITPTPTPLTPQKAQLVITKYSTDIDPLQPGAQFKLQIEISNVGSANARSVTMVIGGGSFSSGGTPDAGGIAGGSGEFTNFAPLGSSNIQSLGDLAAGAKLNASMQLIVNVTTNPAAYPMKISLVYADAKGNIIADEQVITLLVYSLPQVEVGFYRDPNPLFSGQMSQLPLQVTNLGRKTTVLGNMIVTADNADLTNNTMLVGVLDPGGYFTLDANFIPFQPGSMELTVLIEYTDDFNQPRQLTKTLTVDVLEYIEPTLDPNMGNGGEVIPEEPETIWQKIWRFVLGIFGLDSGKTQNTNDLPLVQPEESFPLDGKAQPLKGP